MRVTFGSIKDSDTGVKQSGASSKKKTEVNKITLEVGIAHDQKREDTAVMTKSNTEQSILADQRKKSRSKEKLSHVPSVKTNGILDDLERAAISVARGEFAKE